MVINQNVFIEGIFYRLKNCVLLVSNRRRKKEIVREIGGNNTIDFSNSIIISVILHEF